MNDCKFSNFFTFALSRRNSVEENSMEAKFSGVELFMCDNAYMNIYWLIAQTKIFAESRNHASTI